MCKAFPSPEARRLYDGKTCPLTLERAPVRSEAGHSRYTRVYRRALVFRAKDECRIE
jgi:hypothetical protein